MKYNSKWFGGAFALAEMIPTICIVALFAGLAIPKAQASDIKPQFDFPIAAGLNADTTTNGTVAVVTNNWVAVPPGEDLTIAVMVNPATILVLRSNAVVGLDLLYGPLGGQRTSDQPIQLTVPITATNVCTHGFFLSRTNFNGCVGVAVDSYVINDSTNIMKVPLGEVSGNWKGQ